LTNAIKQSSLNCEHPAISARLPNARDHHTGVSGMSQGEVLTTQATTQYLAELEDSDIFCVDCSQNFVWTVGEQAFFRDKKLQHPPKRCKDCKKAKNKRLKAIELAKTLGIRQRVEVTVKCGKCGEMTTVPFYPSQGRPVFCRACFLEGKPIRNGAGNPV